MKHEYSERFREKCARINRRLNCFITLADFSDEDAKLLVSVKDNISTKGIKTTAGSMILSNYIPPYDATVVSKIKEAGGIIIGKTSMDEFGFGSYGIHCFTGPTLNPWDIKRVSGGSSSGAAAAVAAIEHSAIAESTGGSITTPASFCGVVGFTPTYGRVSRYGLIDYANSLDKIGVISRTVRQAKQLFDIINGCDEMDMTSAKTEQKEKKRKMRIGIPTEYMNAAEDEIQKLISDYINRFEELGFSIEKVNLPMTKYCLPSYYIIAASEASTNLAKFCGLRYGREGSLEDRFDNYFSKIRGKCFGAEAKRRIILGTFARMAGYRNSYYLKALAVRQMVIGEFKRIFDKYDFLVSPSARDIAPKLKDVENIEPIEEYMTDIITIPPNLAGLPHISIPCGFSRGMPVGIQIIADYFQEDSLFTIVGIAEKWFKRKTI